MISTNGLVEKLRRIQLERGLSNQEMADLLGVKRQMWWMMYKGKVNPGAKTIRGILDKFPELTLDVFMFMRRPKRPEEERVEARR